jgi:FMN-dependent NADH-azoreductase
MAKLIYIESSPRKTRSKSIAVSLAFLEAYSATHPSDEITTIDLWEKNLPEFDGHIIDAKYQVMNGLSFDENQHKAWKSVVDICDEFKSGDKYLFSLPMWNFSIPYKLKHYIDVLTQPGQTFNFDPASGYKGLVVGKPVAVVYARGGDYGSEDAKALDFQKGYMDLLLGFLGFTDISSIVIEPTLGSSMDVSKAVSSAMDRAKSVAATI